MLRNALLPVVDDHRPADRAAALGRGAHRDGVRLAGHRLAGSRDAIFNRDYPGAPGRDPLPRGRLRARQPARRHLVRAHQPADPGTPDVGRRARGPAERRARRGRRAGSGATPGARLRRNPGAIVGFVLVGTLRARARSSRRCIAPYDPIEQDLDLARSTGLLPAARRPAHWLGVDHARPRRALADHLRRALLAR